MTAINKIDSNLTGLSYAEELTIGVLPGSPNWIPLEPNDYSDFGGELTLLARNPINPSRQRKKGVITDLDASGGFTTDLTQTNMQDLLQGFFFADLRRKPEFGGAGEITGVVTITDDFQAASGLTIFDALDLVLASGFTANNGLFNVTATTATTVSVSQNLADEVAPPTGAKLVKVGVQTASTDIGVDATGFTLPRIFSTLFDFTTLGLVPGEWIFVGGDLAANQFVQSANNGWKRVREITLNYISLDKSDLTMIDEVPASGEEIQIFLPRSIKNELGSDIVRRTYNLERSLGRSDTGDSQDQTEYLVGAVPNEFNISIPQAEKITAELTFVALDNEQRTATIGPKSGTRSALVESDAINTSSDFSRIKLAQVVEGDEAPVPLFGFSTEANITINNNLSANKALGTLGAFEVTAGTFVVSGDLTVYLSDVAAVAAVRNNEDITFDIAIYKQNTGMVIDVPLIALGDGRANVEQDQPITLPLSMEAASAAAIDSTLDYTMLISFFDYLPDAADT